MLFKIKCLGVSFLQILPVGASKAPAKRLILMRLKWPSAFSRIEIHAILFAIDIAFLKNDLQSFCACSSF